MSDKNTSEAKKYLGIFLIATGPLLLVVCPVVTSFFGYDMFNLSSRISASEPYFDIISLFIKLWWLGIPFTIVGTIIGLVLISMQKKK